jgi:membrane protein
MRVKPFVRKFREEVKQDRIGDVAAMMTYYAIFALFPMLLFVVTIALLVVPDSAIQQMMGMIGAAVPGEVGQLLSQQVGRMQQAAHAGFAIVSALVALWGASRGAASLSKALNDMYEKEETRPWWKQQLVAVGTTLAVAIILLVALGLLVAGPALGHLIADRFGLGAAFDTVWTLGRWVGAAVLVMIVWALLYKVLPDTDAPFRIFTPGAVIGVLLWVAVSQLFAFYVSHFGSYEKTYGTLGGIIIFLMWLWLSNLSLLIGAEINDVLAELKKDRDPAAAKLARQEKPSGQKGGKPLEPQPQS